MTFFNESFEHNDQIKNRGIESIVTNKIVISKKVKSIRQLKNSQKEMVRLCYKEAILKGFTAVKDIQFYIAFKTQIWIEKTGVDYLRKSEEIENKKWYYHMAKDHLVYISVYRKCIDELELVRKECWKIVINANVKSSVKVQSLKEIHRVTQTLVLLLRDLPIIANLSRYYDQEKIDQMFSNE
ncbi:MAG: hypothetical protein R2685_14255 [Candidatus Nitrosocosmicus sp.]|nr:hypothetical protein [Candidatus Nitrosocosmicus sp.]